MSDHINIDNAYCMRNRKGEWYGIVGERPQHNPPHYGELYFISSWHVSPNPYTPIIYGLSVMRPLDEIATRLTCDIIPDGCKLVLQTKDDIRTALVFPANAKIEGWIFNDGPAAIVDAKAGDKIHCTLYSNQQIYPMNRISIVSGHNYCYTREHIQTGIVQVRFHKMDHIGWFIKTNLDKYNWRKKYYVTYGPDGTPPTMNYNEDSGKLVETSIQLTTNILEAANLVGAITTPFPGVYQCDKHKFVISDKFHVTTFI